VVNFRLGSAGDPELLLRLVFDGLSSHRSGLWAFLLIWVWEQIRIDFTQADLPGGLQHFSTLLKIDDVGRLCPIVAKRVAQFSPLDNVNQVRLFGRHEDLLWVRFRLGLDKKSCCHLK